jgi:late competence protein required for DNA uptake (superfamily II DNA/RNA helicase)
VEPKLETEEVIAANRTETQEEQQVHLIEQEIECPRCHGSMELCSSFDNLFYACEECDFCLYTIKRNK